MEGKAKAYYLARTRELKRAPEISLHSGIGHRRVQGSIIALPQLLFILLFLIVLVLLLPVLQAQSALGQINTVFVVRMLRPRRRAHPGVPHARWPTFSPMITLAPKSTSLIGLSSAEVA